MGKPKEQTQIDRELLQQQQYLERMYDQYIATLDQRGSEAYDRARQQYADAIKRYTDFMSGLSGMESQWDELISGGVSPEQMDEIRGYGGFREFAQTGGLDEAARQNIRQRSNATVPAFYANLRRNMERGQVTGGPNLGFDAQQALLARQAAQGASEQGLKTETDLMKLINEGRQWGISGVSDAGTRIAELLSRNKIAGMTGKQGMYGLNLDAIKGMASLDPNYGLPYDTLGLSARNARSLNIGNMLGQRSANAYQSKNWWDSWGKYAAAGIAGAGGTMFGGPVVGMAAAKAVSST